VTPIGDADLAALDAAIDLALFTRDDNALRILGYGEISSVVAWPTASPLFACKRLPLFDADAAAQTYRDCVARYLDRLSARGVHPVETEVRSVERDDGRIAVYCVQPILHADRLAPDVARALGPEDRASLYDSIFDAIAGCVDERLGLDAQLSNWVVHEDGALAYLDVSTPLMRIDGRDELPVDLFLSSLPWALRGVVKKTMLSSILDKYYDVRAAFLDLIGNLYKERLAPDGALERANRRLTGGDIELAEVRRYYRRDARMWSVLQLLRRADRAWQERVRGRAYPFLLPGSIERHV
jgi:hypothetical protein